jgi:glycine cleavage system H lipoate-binding protein/ABC-type phosphate transport system substrate-binding protein
MKNTILLFSSIFLLNCAIARCHHEPVLNKPVTDHSISIFCSPDLINLTTTWVEEFSYLNPDVKIEINAVGPVAAENPTRQGTLGLMSDEYKGTHDKSKWNLVVGRAVIVPIYNTSNPYKDKIRQQGIPLAGLAQIFENPETRTWGTLLNNSQKAPVDLYLIDDGSINSGIAELLDLDQSTIDGVKIENGKKLISSLRKDRFSIGLCNIADISGLVDRGLAESMGLLPIDRNGNGKMDHLEQIYDDLSIFSQGVWTGKYPEALINDIYFTAPEKPNEKSEAAFIKWALTDGQQFLDHLGYSELAFRERQTKVDMFNDHQYSMITQDKNYASAKWVPFIMGSFALIVFMLIVVNLRRTTLDMNKLSDEHQMAPGAAKMINEQSVVIPMGLYYDRSHTWTFMEKDGMVRMGIDDFLQHVTGPLTRVKMKSNGERIRKGKHVLSIIQKGKQLSIHSPVSGTIREQNMELKDHPSLLNSSPYSDGWVYRIVPTNWSRESQFLITWEKYKAWLKSEFSRLKDFLATLARPEGEYAHMLQEGGELRDGILADLGPEVWEDFQTNFIDS